MDSLFPIANRAVRQLLQLGRPMARAERDDGRGDGYSLVPSDVHPLC